jgi:hypothetical protein
MGRTLGLAYKNYSKAVKNASGFFDTPLTRVEF